jgi:SAM-dependent methyltransferase
MEQGFPNLIAGDRFEDELPDAELAFEEASSGATTRNFWIPLFQQVWRDEAAPPVILSLGCGVGTEVDELGMADITAAGIDCGNRVRLWARRRYPNRLLLANGLHLPFPDRSFDGVFCGCVFPHVGVRGDSYEVLPDYYRHRLRLACEIARVLKPNGRLFAANPNRLFPFDMFHKGQAGSLRPRWNSPRDPFLLSLRDLRELFAEAGFRSTRAIPPRHYWSFNRSQRTLKGRLLGLPVRALFRVNGFAPLRSSFLAPWLVVESARDSNDGAGD